MENEIRSTILSTVTQNWVCDEDIYPWREEFLTTYFYTRYYYVHECLDMIDNNAHDYIRILKKVYNYSKNNQFEIDITSPLELFNYYYYMLARDILYYDNNVQDRINEIRRIQKMDYIVPLILHTIDIHPVRTTIMTYLSPTY